MVSVCRLQHFGQVIVDFNSIKLFTLARWDWCYLQRAAIKVAGMGSTIIPRCRQKKAPPGWVGVPSGASGNLLHLF